MDALATGSPVGFAFLDTENRFVRANEALGIMFDKPFEEMLGKRLSDIAGTLGPDIQARLQQVIVSGRAVADQELTGAMPFAPDFQRHWSVSLFPVRSSDGAVSGGGLVVLETTGRKLAEEHARSAEARLRLLVDGVRDHALIVLEPSGHIATWNAGAQRLFGYRAEDVIGRPFLALYTTEAANRLDMAAILEEAAGGGRASNEEWNVRSDGSVFYAHTHFAPLWEEGRLDGYGQVTHDTTERREASLALEHRAMHDSLTGLPNRALLRDRVDQALERSLRHGGWVGFLLMDLDHFKEINDSFGHGVGDDLLCSVATRLQECVRGVDTVARLGGDEFVVVLANLTGESDAEVVAQKILGALRTSVTGDTRFMVDMSIGIAVSGADGDTEPLLMKRADVAMYRAKRAGGGYARYDDSIDDIESERLTLVPELRNAIDKNELFLVYQPKLDLASGRTLSMEALVRWNHPREGLLLPGQFLPLAEENGLIRPLTDWMIRTALNQCATWHADGHEVSVAVNLSTVSVQDASLPKIVQDALEDARADPGWLTFEISELALSLNASASGEVLVRLQEQGVSFCLDGFGTGHLSLANVRRLPLDEIKISNTFVRALRSDLGDRSIVKSVIDLGHNLDLRVVADGVEDRETVDLLRTMGCDGIQGAHVRPPLSAAEASGCFGEGTLRT